MGDAETGLKSIEENVVVYGVKCRAEVQGHKESG